MAKLDELTDPATLAELDAAEAAEQSEPVPEQTEPVEELDKTAGQPQVETVGSLSFDDLRAMCRERGLDNQHWFVNARSPKDLMDGLTSTLVGLRAGYTQLAQQASQRRPAPVQEVPQPEAFNFDTFMDKPTEVIDQRSYDVAQRALDEHEAKRAVNAWNRFTSVHPDALALVSEIGNYLDAEGLEISSIGLREAYHYVTKNRTATLQVAHDEAYKRGQEAQAKKSRAFSEGGTTRGPVKSDEDLINLNMSVAEMKKRLVKAGLGVRPA